MKNLSKFIFCTFAIALFYSCEPEDLEISSESQLTSDFYSGTGDQETPIDDKKD